MPTERKQTIVADLAEKLSRSNLVILTDYRGLTMRELTGLRRSLERVGAGFHVVKNTLLLRALNERAMAGLEPYLEGPTAVVFAYEDAITAIKALKEQLVSMPIVKIKGGWMQGQGLPPAAVEALAALPPRPILLGQVVGVLQSPMANLIGTLAGVLRQLVYVLKTRSEQEAEPEPEAPPSVEAA